MANIHIISDTSTHIEQFLAKNVDDLALFCICNCYFFGLHYEKIREAFEKEKLEVPVFEEVRGGMMATIKREKFMAIQAKSGDVENGKDVVDVVIDNVVEKLSERQVVIYKMIRKSVVDGVVETASSIASKIKLSSRTIQRDLTHLKDLKVIKHEGPDNEGCWVILMDLNV